MANSAITNKFSSHPFWTRANYQPASPTPHASKRKARSTSPTIPSKKLRNQMTFKTPTVTTRSTWPQTTSQLWLLASKRAKLTRVQMHKMHKHSNLMTMRRRSWVRKKARWSKRRLIKTPMMSSKTRMAMTASFQPMKTTETV